jgi:Lrp/AsnC family transcriptional regulator for asnA, asnC and gidA
MDIDQISRRILAILQRDGRCPNTVIARDLGISEAAVRSMIGVQATKDLGAIAELVSTWPETTYVVISAGSFDLLIELVCTDNNDLLRVVERLRAVEGVRSTESFIYISRHKLNYAWASESDQPTKAMS